MVKVKKLSFYLSLFLVKIGLEILVSDVLDRRNGFPGYRNVHFTELPY